MEQSYWLERWANRQLGFDQPSPNSLLKAHFNQLAIEQNATVFVPLTGKTVDVAWLLDRGFKVVGCELSEQAVIELFEILDIAPNIEIYDRWKLYHSERLRIFVGDFFDLNTESIGEINAIYDRAAMVALPLEMRKAYAQHLQIITKHAPIFLIVFEYDQSRLPGPPFSISEDEIRQHYAQHFNIESIESIPVSGLLKGKVPAVEHAWRLKYQSIDSQVNM